MKFIRAQVMTFAIAAFLAAVAFGGSTAHAGCVQKAAEATAESEASAKWFAMETMVQSVSWSLWPAFLADGSVPGYTVKNKKYRCSSGGAGVTCKGQALFCKQ